MELKHIDLANLCISAANMRAKGKPDIANILPSIRARGVLVPLIVRPADGEDRFEIFVPPAQAARVWLALLQAGVSHDIKPFGLGARDTLRLEAGMRLYGNDMDETVSVLEAGLGWIVGWQKPDFLGAARLRAEKASGCARRLVAFEMIERAIARHGHSVIDQGVAVGRVTSGTHTPFLRKAIGFANVPAALSAVGTELEIDIRGRRARARVVPEPFYKRPRPA